MKKIISILIFEVLMHTICVSQTIESLVKELPSYFSILTTWGLRPEWDEKSENIYFLNKMAGDVFKINIETRTITCITCGFYHSGIFRALCLANGDLLLGIGDGKVFDPAEPERGRHRLAMFILKKDDPNRPVPLNEYCDEGPAISRKNMRIAYTLPGQREIIMAEINYTNDVPSLINKKKIISYNDSTEYVRLETQDFRGLNDDELLYTHYWGDAKDSFHHSQTYGFNIQTGKYVNYTKLPNSYNEAEGIFPDGKSICIESDRHQPMNNRNKYKLDVYRLSLDGTGKAVRIADFSTRYTGILRSDNPVVDNTGKFIALQFGFMSGSGDGRGLFLFDVEKFDNSLKHK